MSERWFWASCLDGSGVPAVVIVRAMNFFAAGEVCVALGADPDGILVQAPYVDRDPPADYVGRILLVEEAKIAGSLWLGRAPTITSVVSGVPSGGRDEEN